MEEFRSKQKLEFPTTTTDHFPRHFRCPISMELMQDPVTISTGVTYERKNIEKWFYTYKKKTCPATNQTIYDFNTTPNHTLKRLILAWKIDDACSSPPWPFSAKHEEIVGLINTIQSSPFKVSSLKKLRSVMTDDDKVNFIRLDGIEVLVKIVDQILVESSDFSSFEACEEALGLLSQFSLSREGKAFQLLSKSESMNSMAIMLQRGSAEARLYTITIFRNMARNDYDWNFIIQDQGIDFFKSLLDLVSDEICNKAGSYALEVLIYILESSKKTRLRAIEAGAICVLIELLIDSNRSKCEKMLEIVKLLCECAEGRCALVEHGMGIAVVTKTMLNVSHLATKIGVKILFLICNFHQTEKVLEEMMICGSVRKLLALLHVESGRSSTKDKVIKIFKFHGNSWKRFSCFPTEFKEYLKFVK